ncbi:TolC family outer membrane protein [Enterobacter asburiae]|uniref:TolC family outer membrane protein n=1 Tax=Enterobacter asburiae TaxID=61645 RepID=UPI00207521CE|nr:TolC family outer membrane protein [Enterobacter asburiae]MCM7773450.1 TolC family outer membrane protein [Enterobacter asburiae]
MRMLRIMICVLLACKSANAATLLEAINAAGEWNSEYQAKKNAQLAGQEKWDQGLAGLLPTVQLDGNYTQQDQPSASYAAKVTRHNYSVNVSQPLFDVSKYADFMRGQALAKMADVEFARAQQKLISDVSSAYFEVLYQREVLQASRAAMKVYGRQLAQAKAALELGEGLRMDVDEALANYDRASSDQIAVTNALDVANINFHRLTGLDAEQIDTISESCAARPPSQDLKTLLMRSDADNLDIRYATFQVAQTQADVTAAYGSQLPVVNLQAGYGGNWSRGEDENVWDSVFGTTSKTRNTTIGVVVSVPIFNGGGQMSRAREAAYNREQAKDLLEDARSRAQQDTRAAWLDITNGIALLKAQHQAVNSAENKVKSTEYGREMGLRSGLDELNARQRYYDVIRELADARYNLLKSRIKLLSVTGQLGFTSINALTCRASAADV